MKANVLLKKTRLLPSINRWDWLGHGIYFWEADPKRALEYAKIFKTRSGSKIRNPSVIGAVIDAGNCLNLLNRSHLVFLKRAYLGLKKTMTLNQRPLPANRSLKGAKNDLLLRDLDCAVFNYLHEVMKEEGHPQFDSVRAAFWEGEHLYPGAGFRELSHIQICIRNPNCIKGYFDPLKSVGGWPHV